MAHWASFKVVRTRVVQIPTMATGPQGTGYQLGVLFGDTVGAPAEKRQERKSPDRREADLHVWIKSARFAPSERLREGFDQFADEILPD